MTVTLQPVTADNWRESVRLQVGEEQTRYVAPNVYSLAEAHFVPSCVCLAIYDDDIMVGFTMYDANDYYIVRFMIDKDQQGKGYGHAAMRLLLAQFERDFAHPTTSLSYVPGNEVAERLYERVGFRKTGEIHEGEIVMERPLQRN